MSNIEKIYKYLTEECENEDKEKSIRLIKAKFKLTDALATRYYYEWKKKFMQNINCVPNTPAASKTKEIIKEVKQKDTSKKEEESKPSKPKLKIKKAEIEGEYGEYIISNDGVQLGDQLFKTPEDIEKYRLKELEEFYAQLREINEVMAMI